MSRRKQKARDTKKCRPKAAPARRSFWRGDFPTLLAAVALALCIRAFVFETFYVPSGSMLPTLLVGDHVFVNKFVYGPKLPFADWRLGAPRAPQRGEVAVFRFARGPHGQIAPPDEAPNWPTDNFIKRLVGMPGDRVAFSGGRLILNGRAVPLEDTGRIFTDGGGRRLRLYIETLGACRHYVLDDPQRPGITMPEQTIPPGRYLMMGDNRDDSRDGRSAGSIRLVDFAGPAGLNYWSWDWNGGWLELLNPLLWYENLSEKMRWKRMGETLRCLTPEDEANPKF